MKLPPIKPTLLREIALGLLTVGFLSFLVLVIYQTTRVQRLTLAAGSSTRESYIVCAALKTVVERHNANLKISLLETGGTVENLKLLEDGHADLAVAQADVLTGAGARILAVLFDDTFQLLTHQDSPVHDFYSLRGKTVALPRAGGQFQSFLRVAAHFGLSESDFRFVGETDSDADRAFSAGIADASFRVRALGNPSIQSLVQSGHLRLVRVDHAAAMRIHQPAFQPTIIPAGAYMGNPAVPAEDVPSVAVHRALLASAGTNDDTVRGNHGKSSRPSPGNRTRDFRIDNASVRLLLAPGTSVRMFRRNSGLQSIPGAIKFYEKDKPSFILVHADYIGLMITILVMVGSWIMELRSWLRNRQKGLSDGYSNRVVVLMNRAMEAGSVEALEEIRAELLAILGTAVGDLDDDKLSSESFHSFRAILQIGLEAVRDRRAVLNRSVQTVTAC